MLYSRPRLSPKPFVPIDTNTVMSLRRVNYIALCLCFKPPPEHLQPDAAAVERAHAGVALAAGGARAHHRHVYQGVQRSLVQRSCPRHNSKHTATAEYHICTRVTECIGFDRAKDELSNEVGRFQVFILELFELAVLLWCKTERQNLQQAEVSHLHGRTSRQCSNSTPFTCFTNSPSWRDR